MSNRFALASSTLLCLLLVAAHPAPTPLGHDALIGSWSTTITPDDDARHAGERDIKDKLIFKGGTFSSTEFAKRGFDPGPYDEEIHPGSVGGFTAVQNAKAAGDGNLKWNGFVAAGELSGTLVWTKKDGTVLNYTFKGSKG
jgi:hypothetical protein